MLGVGNMARTAFPFVLGLMVVAAVSSIEGAATRTQTLPFIENDFEKALSSANKSRKPLFIEVWAPW